MSSLVMEGLKIMLPTKKYYILYEFCKVTKLCNFVNTLSTRKLNMAMYALCNKWLNKLELDVDLERISFLDNLQCYISHYPP